MARKDPGSKTSPGVHVVQATLNIQPQRSAETADSRSKKATALLGTAGVTAVALACLLFLHSQWWLLGLPVPMLCLLTGMYKRHAQLALPAASSPLSTKDKRDNAQESSETKVVKPSPDGSKAPRYRVRLLGALVLAALVAGLLYKLLSLFDAGWVQPVSILVAACSAYVVIRRCGAWYAGMSITRPAPKQGFAHLLHIVFYTLRIPYIPPRGKSEQLDDEIASAEDEHYRIVHAHTGDAAIKVAVLGTMGGVGCSTVASNTAELSAENSHLPTFLGDWRFGTGNLVQRFGFLPYPWGADASAYDPVFAPTIRQCIKLMQDGKFTSPTRRRHLMRSSRKCDLTFMAADGPSVIKGQDGEDQSVKRDKFDVSEGIAVLDEFSRSDSVMILEGNSDGGEDLDLALANWVDRHWFVTRVNMPFADDDLAGLLGTYRSESPALKAKIDEHGHLIVLATKPKHSRAEFAKAFGFPEDRVVMVPYHVYFELTRRINQISKLKDGQAPEPIINTATMPREAKLVYLQLLNSTVRSLQNSSPAQETLASTTTTNGSQDPAASNGSSDPADTGQVISATGTNGAPRALQTTGG